MTKNIAIVGSDFVGLTLALRLADAGDNVTIFEAAGEIGGPARAWKMGELAWDKFYCPTISSDDHFRRLLDEIGLSSEYRTARAKAGFLIGDNLLPISTKLEALKFPNLSPVGKLRLAAAIFQILRTKDLAGLENVAAEDWLVKKLGKRAYDKVLKPLLRSHFGEGYRGISATAACEVIRRVFGSARPGAEDNMFGYVRGGNSSVLKRLGDLLIEKGVEVRLNSHVNVVEKLGDGKIYVRTSQSRRHKDIKPRVMVQKTKYSRFRAAAAVAPGFSGAFLSVPNYEFEEVIAFPPQQTGDRFDAVILTCSPQAGANLAPQLSTSEKTDLSKVEHQGMVCASVLTKCSPSPFYLTNMTDDLPFDSVIDMSVVGKREFGGNVLLYVTKYAASDDPIFDKSDDQIKASFIGALDRAFPHFKPQDVLTLKIARDRHAFPLAKLKTRPVLPNVATSVAGLYMVNQSPGANGFWDVNDSLQMAERVYSDHFADR